MRLPLLCVLLMVVLAGCVFVSKEVHYYDEQCNVTKRKYVLTSEQVASLGACSGQACALAMAGAGIVSAASLVVSGTIVLSKNTLSWLEQSEGCTTPKPSTIESQVRG